jgi:glycosyltransferase involved in cell wall biosynthesis
MRILFHYPEWGNSWIEPIINVLSTGHYVRTTSTIDGKELGALSERADLLLSGWADRSTYFWAKYFPYKKIVSFVRRYEFFSGIMEHIEWGNINALIFVSDFWRDFFNDKYEYSGRQEVIRNGVDLSMFPLNERIDDCSSSNIAMICQTRAIKNLPLAAQVLLHLPDNYKIYHIGLPGEDMSYFLPYLKNLGISGRFIFEGTLKREQISSWLSDKKYILSTSINEGNPNNVIEAMATGCKPIVHDWPGSSEQFPFVFKTPLEASDLIIDCSYNPNHYREWVKKRYSLSNFNRVLEVIEDV